MTKVFIDGSAGTTGLRIRERLADRRDLQQIVLPEALRKDPDARRDALNRADVAFLCLPDDAAREAAQMVTSANTAVIDTSTAHRTASGWVYGFAELGYRKAIVGSHRIANPGCHAGGFLALVTPLIRHGLLDPAAEVTCFSLTGYSGGGKKMIADYADPVRQTALEAPRMYGLNQTHKHLPEMQIISGLKTPPIFCPVVSSYYAGMQVVVPLFADQVNGGAAAIRALYREVYADGLVRYCDAPTDDGFLSAGSFAGRDDMEISVCGGEARVLLVARFDNLGKGASGAAIQNMNLVLGLDETTGLNVGEKTV